MSITDKEEKRRRSQLELNNLFRRNKDISYTLQEAATETGFTEELIQQTLSDMEKIDLIKQVDTEPTEWKAKDL